MYTKLKNMIQRYAYSCPLDERFNWDFPLDDLPSAVVSLLPNSNAFENNIALKNCLRNHLRCNGYSMDTGLFRSGVVFKDSKIIVKTTKKL